VDLNTKLNQSFNFLSIKRDHNSYKRLDTVVCSCLKIGVMLVKKYATYESNMSRDIDNI